MIGRNLKLYIGRKNKKEIGYSKYNYCMMSYPISYA